MAKLRDTVVKDNLNIAGSVVADGKVLSVEGHTHTPANITGLDTYINQKIQAAGGTGGSGTPVVPSGDINAKTLDGHPVSDFVLKTESIGSGGNDQYQVYWKSVLLPYGFTNHLIIELTEEFTNECQIYVEDNNSIITLDKRLSPIDVELKKASDRRAFASSSTQLVTYSRASGVSNIALFNLNTYNPTAGVSSYLVSIRVVCNKEDINKINISTSSRSKYSTLNKARIPYEINLKNFLIYGDAVNMNVNTTNADSTLFKPYFKQDAQKGIVVSVGNGCIIVDLDDGKFINFSNNTWWGPAGTENNSVYSYDSNNLYLVDLTGFSDKNTVVYCRNSFAIPVQFNAIGARSVKVSKTNVNITAYGYDIDKLSNSMKVTNKITINGTKYNLSDNITIAGGSSGGGEINCNINGIHFDGKTDITIPAPTNALTLGGLDSSQYIKATDVGNAAGKIPKFDNDGFLVYPDGSKERIENA